MALTTEDLSEIRNIFESALDTQTGQIIKPIQNEIAALRDDIKEIYEMLGTLQVSDNDSDNQTIEDKILSLHRDLKIAAKQAGVTLPTE